MRSRRKWWVLVGPLALTLAGCSRGPKLVPVSGQLLYEGKPAVGASLVFVPDSPDPAAPRPSGYVAEDGSFTLNTYPFGTGAPPGQYRVSATLYPPNFKELDDPRSLLPDRYANPAGSPLKASVGDGPTVLEPFRLTKR